MFSGIIEIQVPVLQYQSTDQSVLLTLGRPAQFNDLTIGDSVCVDGACLTVENFDSASMSFTLSAETLQATKWKAHQEWRQPVNVERSLQLGDRLHGHFVTGHVDGVATVLAARFDGTSRHMTVRLPTEFKWALWRKGSVTLNGVSLTVNDVSDLGEFEICLIPETLRITNLAGVEAGDLLNFEIDYLVKAVAAATERMR